MGNKEEERDFWIIESDSGLGGLSSLCNRPICFGGIAPVKIQVKTLDDYCETYEIMHIDFLKIDTEGNELNVLYGASKLLDEKAVDFIQIEYGLCWRDMGVKIADCLDFLNNKGYKVYVWNDGLKEIVDKEDTYEINTCINYLITHKEI